MPIVFRRFINTFGNRFVAGNTNVKGPGKLCFINLNTSLLTFAYAAIFERSRQIIEKLAFSGFTPFNWHTRCTAFT